MTAGAAVPRAAAEVALRVGVQFGVPASRFLALVAVAGAAGHRSGLDRLAAVLLAVADGGDAEAAIWRRSPEAERDRLAHLRAEVYRCCGREADWASQTRREIRRGGRNGTESWAVRAARDAADALFPGRGSAVRAKRTAWLRSIGAVAPGPAKRRRKRAGGAA